MLVHNIVVEFPKLLVAIRDYAIAFATKIYHAIGAIYNGIFTIWDNLVSFFHWIRSQIVLLWALVCRPFVFLWNLLTNLWISTIEVIRYMHDKTVEYLYLAWNAFITPFIYISRGVSYIWALFKQLPSVVANAILSLHHRFQFWLFTVFFLPLMESIYSVGNSIASLVRSIYDTGVAAIARVASCIGSAISLICRHITAAVNSLLSTITSAILAITNRISSFLSWIWNCFTFALQSLLDLTNLIIHYAYDKVASALHIVWNVLVTILRHISQHVSFIWNQFTQLLIAGVSTILSYIGRFQFWLYTVLFLPVVEAIHSFVTSFASILRRIYDFGMAVITRAVSCITSAISMVAVMVANHISSLFSWMWNCFTFALQSLLDFITDILVSTVHYISSMLQRLAHHVALGLSAVWEYLILGESILTRIWNPMKNTLQLLWNGTVISSLMNLSFSFFERA